MVISKDIKFDCAHMLSNYEGKCANLHGHTYHGTVTLIGDVHPTTDMLVQERMTKQIIDDINKYLNPIGTMVVITAEHMCMTMRGIQKPGTKTTTSRVSGVFFDEAKARAEALELIKE